MNGGRELTLKEIIYVTGYLEGIWIAFGLNPEGTLIESLAEVMTTLGVGPGQIFLFKLLPMFLFGLSLLMAYKFGGKLGLVAVILALIGGVLIIAAPLFSGVLLIAALLLGAIAEG